MERNIYLKMVPLVEAQDAFFSAFDWVTLVGTEERQTAEALGRVTAAPVFSALSSPGYHGAAMDGIAVRASETYSASEEQPLQLELGKQAHHVNTGNPLPAGSDAVIMIEQVYESDRVVEIRAPAFPWQHVRRVGEDIVAGELLLPHHHRLSAVDVAALITAGVFRVSVLRRPKVAILATGSELVDWREVQQQTMEPGQIIESNSLLLSGLVSEGDGQGEVLARCPDDLEDLRQALEAALQSDAHMIVVNAGVSAGSKDFTRHIVSELGEVLVHGVMAMPGKPTLLGKVRDKPVVGTPGYPVSAWVCHDQFIAPALALMQGQLSRKRRTVTVTPARRLPSKLGHEEFLRVHLGRVDQRIVATPLKRGAGAITSLTRADGILRIPADSEGVDEDSEATAELLHPPAVLDCTVVIVGSHDITLDHLGDHIRRKGRQVHLSASNVGSLAGLMAIAAGRCHMGGTHLLDTETGEYNVSYVQRYLQGMPAQLVTLALREQGLIVAKGNPKRIAGFADLARPDVRLVNRQGGSGTRVLLDYHLAGAGIDASAIQGYDDEEYTHMAVAVQVLAGSADVGLGIAAAARALDLDFVPVASERYDLCIPEQYLDEPRVAAVVEALHSASFRKIVESLGGYDVSPMGTIAWRS